jgi:hypothetical protein
MSAPPSATIPEPPLASRPKATPKAKAFPLIQGSCTCSTVRYRLLTSPLFCYACHCPDCQKTTGSAFGLYLNIETSNLQVLSPTQPILITQLKRPGAISRSSACPNCKTELWSNNSLGAVVADVRVGTLGFPSLMEPDVHCFVESKLEWVRLPKGARTTEGRYDYRAIWPKSSLDRLDKYMKKVKEDSEQVEEAAQAHVPGRVQVAREGHVRVGEEADGEKTPTGKEEDDEAFEERVRETELGLQKRLERLQRKLEEDGGSREDEELERATAGLKIGDCQAEQETATVDEGLASQANLETSTKRVDRNSKVDRGPES